MADASYLDDDGSSQMVVIDNGPESTQALWVRVGPVYHGTEIQDKPGVWIEYQPRHMESKLEGPVLISVDTWIELATAVNERIAKFDKDNYNVTDVH